MSFKEVKSEPRQDWHFTSAGVGHHYRPGLYFPSSDFRSVMHDPLPSALVVPDQITKDQKHDTTTGHVHDRKYPFGTYGQPNHKKAPGHWQVNYVKDHNEKLGSGGWRQPLTMGNELSETHDQFAGLPGAPYMYAFDGVFEKRPFLLQDHHYDGPSKVGCGSSKNPKLAGQVYYVRDKGVLKLNDPYLSVTHKDHRSFKPEELSRYPKKNIPTYWECEEYPKSWGHGLRPGHCPLPKNAVPREALPMRDHPEFKTPTKIPRLPKSFNHVPHLGLQTLYQDSYTFPSDVKAREIYYCREDTPWTLPYPSAESIMTVPQMYKSDYTNIGSEKSVPV